MLTKLYRMPSATSKARLMFKNIFLGELMLAEQHDTMQKITRRKIKTNSTLHTDHKESYIGWTMHLHQPDEGTHYLRKG